MAVSNRVRAALTTTVLTTAATGFMAGCGVGGGEEEEEQVAYCTDENGEIVDDDYCDDSYSGAGRGLLLPLPRRLPARACRSARCCPRGGTRISPTDTAARQRAGLPASGKVSAGTRVSGGIGSGVGNRAGTGAGS